MDEVPEAREIPEPTIEGMVQAVIPAGEVRDANPAARGFCSVYRVVVAGDGEPLELYPKASPDGQPWGIPLEARIQAVLDAQTSVPVPRVRGAVDDHERLPTPFYLMGALPGEELAYERVSRLEENALKRLARDTGGYLGELHSVPAVERFGHVRHDGPELAGGEPSGDAGAPSVGQSGYRTPRRPVRAGARAQRPWVAQPAGRARRRGDRDARLGYTLAVPAAFDFEFATYLFSGVFLAGLPDVPDRRPLVREAMVAGYREAAPERADTLASHEPLYEALAMVRVMNDFEHLSVPDGSEGAVMARVEADARELLAGDC